MPYIYFPYSGNTPAYIKQCLYKSIGATLHSDDRIHFDAFVKQLMKKPIILNDSIDQPANSNQCPGNKITLYQYYFDLKRYVWIAYDWIVPQYVHNSKLNYNEIFVPNADSVRINHILNQLSNVSKTMEKKTENKDGNFNSTKIKFI